MSTYAWTSRNGSSEAIAGKRKADEEIARISVATTTAAHNASNSARSFSKNAKNVVMNVFYSNRNHILLGSLAVGRMIRNRPRILYCGRVSQLPTVEMSLSDETRSIFQSLNVAWAVPHTTKSNGTRYWSGVLTLDIFERLDV